MMKIPSANNAILWGVLIGGGLFAFSIYRKGLAGATADIVSGTVGAVGNVAAGVVVGAGKAVGIPATNQDQCQRDMARGDNWAASFSCDAATFLKWQGQGLILNIDKIDNFLRG